MKPPAHNLAKAAAIAIAACCAGCFDRDPFSLFSRDAACKIPAIKQAVQQQNDQAIPQLVHDLDSDDPAVRFYAIGGLQRLTGETFGYQYYQDAARRRASVMKWRQWLDQTDR